jgi:hypothetical protein
MHGSMWRGEAPGGQSASPRGLLTPPPDPVTSEGSPYSRFCRALDSGNELLVLTAARELPQIRLDDALRICLVLRDGDPGRYERAAVRWLGRFALEGRAVTIGDLRAAAAALHELPGRSAEAMERLQALCVARGVS